jgi:hypothetical protein
LTAVNNSPPKEKYSFPALLKELGQKQVKLLILNVFFDVLTAVNITSAPTIDG